MGTSTLALHGNVLGFIHTCSLGLEFTAALPSSKAVFNSTAHIKSVTSALEDVNLRSTVDATLRRVNLPPLSTFMNAIDGLAYLAT